MTIASHLRLTLRPPLLLRYVLVGMAILSLHGCGFTTDVLVHDDLRVSSEVALHKANAGDRQAFLASQQETNARLMVTTVARDPWCFGVGIGPILKPSEMWSESRPTSSRATAVFPDPPSSYPIRWAVSIPDERTLVVPIQERPQGDGCLLGICRADEPTAPCPIPDGETIRGMRATGWIAEKHGFYLITTGDQRNMTLWFVTRGTASASLRLNRIGSCLADQPHLALGDGPIFWSAEQARLYLACPMRDSEEPLKPGQSRTYYHHCGMLVQLDPATLSSKTLSTADDVHGTSSRAVFLSRCQNQFGGDASELVARDLNSGNEVLELVLRGSMEQGSLSPDGKYIVLPNTGYLHSWLDSFYGPTLLFGCELGERRPFVIDVSFEHSGVLGWSGF
jgi:hypothetical protein